MNKYILRASIISGIVAGAFCIVSLIVFTNIDVLLFDPFIHVDIWIPFVFTIITLYVCRYSVNENSLRFWEALIICALVTDIAALVASIGLVTYVSSFAPELLNESIQAKIAEMMQNKEDYLLSWTEPVFELQVQKLKETTVFDIAIHKFLLFMLLGFIYSLILSMIFRK